MLELFSTLVGPGRLVMTQLNESEVRGFVLFPSLARLLEREQKKSDLAAIAHA